MSREYEWIIEAAEETIETELNESTSRINARLLPDGQIVLTTAFVSKLLKTAERMSESKLDANTAKELISKFTSQQENTGEFFSKRNSLTLSRTSAVALIAGVIGIGTGCLPESSPDILKAILAAEASVVLGYLPNILTASKIDLIPAGSVGIIWKTFKNGEYTADEIVFRTGMARHDVDVAINRLVGMGLLVTGSESVPLASWTSSCFTPHKTIPASLSPVCECILDICCKGTYRPSEIAARSNITTSKCVSLLTGLEEQGLIQNNGNGFWSVISEQA
ncbi:hypothetical protein FYZ48_10925 [Gimesia chilikensis]|uniref:hypothetical protein n=1 Tax=Gimesia chilikensis TaxID=2605989 RepID=UPI0011F0767F|nr:hypothetical protein [Gimesia chilikensis]KAA0139149.1 hypothetical protein FYZ48_10925 [Gimesia chilikensis]